MDVFHAIGIGFATALTLKNIIYCFIGAFVGTVVGVLPGLGPVATISLLLPFSFTMDITSAIILMAGIFYGAQYGGSITAILVRIPGEASAVVTCLDGYAMARKGRAGAALGIAAFGSFIAGILVTIALFLVGPAMSGVALAFGPAEYTALVLLGLLLVTQLSSGSQTKALLMVSFGLLLSTVGRDPIYGAERFTFGIFSIYDGLNMALLAMGLFGVAELLIMAEGGAQNAAPVARGFPICCPTPRTGARASGRSCAAPGWAFSSACCRAAARRWRRSPPMWWNGGSPRNRSASGRAPSRAWRDPNPPTTRRRNPPSCRCCRSAFRPMR
jgi:putative tricarboxylic transport membrane protein